MALYEDTTIADLCKEFELHPTQINERERQLLDDVWTLHNKSLGAGHETVVTAGIDYVTAGS